MVQQHISNINKQIKAAVYQSEEKLRIIKLLCSVPGVGFTTATTIYAELMNIERFDSVEKLCCYVGLTPDTRSSGDKNSVIGLSVLHLRYLRNMLLESAWTAVRKDPALTECYGKYITRMSKQEAIVKIAVKLLRRIAYVWKQNKEYVYAVVA
jgi:transposase